MSLPKVAVNILGIVLICLVTVLSFRFPYLLFMGLALLLTLRGEAVTLPGEGDSETEGETAPSPVSQA